jgi:hypothetical protein
MVELVAIGTTETKRRVKFDSMQACHTPSIPRIRAERKAFNECGESQSAPCRKVGSALPRLPAKAIGKVRNLTGGRRSIWSPCLGPGKRRKRPELLSP